MASCDIRSVREGLAANLRTVTGLRVHSTVPDSITPPSAVVAFPELVSYDSTISRGSDLLEVPVHVLVGKVSDRAANARLDAYMSGGGIKAAIESDTSLGGSAQTCRVTEAETNVMTVGGQDYLGAVFTVEILT